jgi:radical SAM superfamily enzyme YgiQ (UPF0313 family)
VKVLLIHPHSKALGFGDMIRAEPLGLESIAGNLRGHLVKILDLRIEGKRGLEEALSSFRPEVVGRGFIENLDELPFPLRVRYKGVGYHLGFQRPLGLVEASRGCPLRK